MTSRIATLSRERLIVACLLVLAAVAWALLVWQAGSTTTMGMGLTMGMGAPLFLAIWVLMMVAMMFPTAAPMIVMFARIQAGKRQQGVRFVPTWLFVAAYLLVWTTFGALAFLIAVGAQMLGDRVPWLVEHAAQIGGVVLILAGLYQLSPLKRVCLTKCRSPLSFIMTSWRDGHGGAMRMGLQHGLFCLGCCWLLFVILFPLGLMNVVAMVVITLLIFAEKSLPLGHRLAQVGAVVLVVFGALVLVFPQLLPASGAMTGGM
jgi:predicted metal-binding membrane protein